MAEVGLIQPGLGADEGTGRGPDVVSNPAVLFQEGPSQTRRPPCRGGEETALAMLSSIRLVLYWQEIPAWVTQVA